MALKPRLPHGGGFSDVFELHNVSLTSRGNSLSDVFHVRLSSSSADASSGKMVLWFHSKRDRRSWECQVSNVRSHAKATSTCAPQEVIAAMKHALTCASLTSHVEATSQDLARVDAVMSDDGSHLTVLLAVKTPIGVDGYVFEMVPFAQDEANGQLQAMLQALRTSAPSSAPANAPKTATFVPESVTSTQDIRWSVQSPQAMPCVVLSEDATALVLLRPGRFVVQWNGQCGPGLALFENDKRLASTRTGDFQHLSTVIHVERGVTILRATAIRPLQSGGPSLVLQEV